MSLILDDNDNLVYLQVLELLKPSMIWFQAYLFMVQPHPAKLNGTNNAWETWLIVITQCTVDSWTMWGLGVSAPHLLQSQKSTYNFWFPPKLNCPVVSTGDWFHNQYCVRSSLAESWMRNPGIRRADYWLKNIHVWVDPVSSDLCYSRVYCILTFPKLPFTQLH